MNGHTPGPWMQHPMFPEYVVLAAHADRPIGAAVDAATDLAKYAQYIVRVEILHRHRSGYECAANARLIAAAPELYEALTEIVDSLSTQDDEGLVEHAEKMIKARAALAKAQP